MSLLLAMIRHSRSQSVVFEVLPYAEIGPGMEVAFISGKTETIPRHGRQLDGNAVGLAHFPLPITRIAKPADRPILEGK